MPPAFNQAPGMLAPHAEWHWLIQNRAPGSASRPKYWACISVCLDRRPVPEGGPPMPFRNELRAWELSEVVETVKTAAKDLKDKIVNNWDGTLKIVNTAMGVATGVTVIKAMNSKPKRGLEDMEERDYEGIEVRDTEELDERDIEELNARDIEEHVTRIKLFNVTRFLMNLILGLQSKFQS
ncbi:unnamed protein product [Clonostachys rhizophaga]|uniref:Uncharacterized protein n=1 Tax=Clonostachys rhizophaga TaxID=160324 RepID=A0A9N9YDL5_9HYPO|nr:unnamed protein product [Clonostachys rhizophaga]